MVNIEEHIHELVNNRATARQEMPEMIKTLGLLEVFEMCFELCASVRDTREEAAAFAHETFLNAMKGWVND